MRTRLFGVLTMIGCFASALAACGGDNSPDSGTFVAPRAGKRGLPSPMAKKSARTRSNGFKGYVGYDLPFLPIMLSIDNSFHINVETSGKLVTPLGTFHLGAEGDLTDQNNKPMPAEPGDVTQLIICRGSSTGQCQGYQIGTGRRLRIEMDGHFTADVERKRIVIHADPGSTITVSDSGPPAPVGARGPARIDIAEFDFNETGQATNVDLDHDQGGNTDDLSYDHVTGALQPINGARISRLARYREKKDWHDTGISLGDKVPGEYECLQTPGDQWRQRFTGNDLAADTIIACVKTAEGELGYLVIGRNRYSKPVAYHVYSYVWVR